MKRLALAVAAFAAAASLAPVASAAGCPRDWYHRPSGVQNPLTGREITYCWPMS